MNEAIGSLDDSKIIRDLMNEMRVLNDGDEHSVFKEYRHQIIEYFKLAIIDYDGLKELDQKDFVNKISSHCSDNGMRCKLSSLYDSMKKYYVDDDVEEENGKLEYEDEDIDEILEELDV